MSRAVHTAIVTAVLGGVLAAITGELAAAPLLGALHTPEEVFPLSLLYLRVYFAGLPVILLYNFEAAIFRSAGETGRNRREQVIPRLYPCCLLSLPAAESLQITTPCVVLFSYTGGLLSIVRFYRAGSFQRAPAHSDGCRFFPILINTRHDIF